eukprot:788764-Rhodomonas_salina.5
MPACGCREETCSVSLAVGLEKAKEEYLDEMGVLGAMHQMRVAPILRHQERLPAHNTPIPQQISSEAFDSQQLDWHKGCFKTGSLRRSVTMRMRGCGPERRDGCGVERRGVDWRLEREGRGLPDT